DANVIKTVKLIRKSDISENVSNLSLQVLELWRSIYQKKINKSSKEAETIKYSPISEPIKEVFPKRTLNDQSDFSKITPDDINAIKILGDTIRNKFICMLVQALTESAVNLTEISHPSTFDDFINFSVKVEQECYKTHPDISKYKTHMRSRVLNLKNTKNTGLMSKIFNGVIDPKDYSHMTTAELASESLKKEIQEINSQTMKERMIGRNTSSSSILKCPKCKGKNCSYTQMQTRSGDEPMTNFCFCSDCGVTWRFS
ncbi:MAG: Transcription elongation factor A protein 1, partial [Marteilia pararefringens]